MSLSYNNNLLTTNLSQKQILSTEDNNQNKNTHNIPDTKIIEARTAIVLLNDHHIFTRNQYTQWRLSILFKPYNKQEKNESMQILYISNDPNHSWLSEHNKKDDILPYWDQQKKGSDTNYQQEDNTVIEKYMITPKTNVITFMNETRLVYILDLSLSSATVGNTQSKILLSSVFNTLVNSLKSVIQPFNLDQHIMIRPIIRISVLVDCSPFASNTNVIPLLCSHPTIRVFLQNKIATPSNLDHIIDDLYKQFLSLQNELNQFLKQLQKKRRKMGYDLDVSFEEEMINEQSDNNNNNNDNNSSDKKVDKGQPIDNENKNKTSNVWGVGKTGANLSRILQVGVFAFDVLPNYGRSQLIFITDGSLQLSSMGNQSSFNNQQTQSQQIQLPYQSQEDIITGYLKQFTEKDIQFHVILVSLTVNFIPGRNFGFLPDIDMLKYIAFSTGGSVTNADQYEYLPIINQMDHFSNDKEEEYEQGYYDSEDALTIRPKHQHHYRHHRHHHHHHHNHNNSNIRKHLFIRNNDNNANIVVYNCSSIITYPPNICHRQFILRENHLEKTRYFEHPFSKISNTHIWQYNFPWDPHSITPPIDSRLLKYREYPLLNDVSMIVAARARDGFQLQSVFFTNKKKTHIQITMVLRWQCHIFIEYRIKSLWLNNNNNDDFLERMVSPEAEIYIRCDVEFAHMLQNWNLLKRRVQMVNIILSKQRAKNPNLKSSSPSPSASTSAPTVLPMYTKVEKILTFLYQIFDSDETLKQFTSQLKDENDISILKNRFNSFWHHHQQQQKQSMPNNLNDNDDVDDVTTSTVMINQNKQNYHVYSYYNNWYDFDSIDLLVGDISPYMTPKLASNYNQSFSQQLQDQLNEKLIEIIQLLDEQWADFHYQEKDGKIGFIKWMQSSPSFCEVRLHHIYGRCVALRLCYFNAFQNTQQRQQLKDDLLFIVKQQQYVTICTRPLPLLLLRDKSHFIYSNEDIFLKYNNDNKNIFITSSSYCQFNPSNFNLWYLSLNKGFIGKYIVHEYLNHIIWTWPVCQDDYYQQHGMMPIGDVIFQSLCQTRLNHGYQLVFSIPNHTHFYKESDIGFGIQYFIHKTYQGIRTELWVEPSGCFYWFKHATLEIDQNIISQLITFDQLHTFGRKKANNKTALELSSLPLSLDNNLDHDIENGNEHVKAMLLYQLFDITTVLKNSPFILTCFSCPPFHQMLDNINDSPLEFSISNGPHPGIDELLNDTAKKQLCRLSLSNQYFTFLQYYFDMGLNEMTNNNPIPMVNQSNPEFWKLLVLATDQSVFNGIHDLKQTRCFISIINSRSFYLIILPELNYFISQLYQHQNNTSETAAKKKKNKGSNNSQQLCCYLFECTRRKPMAPKLESPNNANNKQQEYDPISHLSLSFFESPSLSLFQPNFCISSSLGDVNNSSNNNNSNKQSIGINMVKNVTKIYAESYLKSMYTFLLLSQPQLENNTVRENITKVISICSETTTHIDITKYISILALLYQRNDNLLLERDQHLLNKKWKSIVHKSFVPMKLNDIENSSKETEQKYLLYYYQPFNHMNPYLKSKTSIGDQKTNIEFRHIIQYCQHPLFIRFNCTNNNSTCTNSIEIITLSETMKELTKQITIGDGVDKNKYLDHIFEDNGKYSAQINDTITLNLVDLTIPSSQIEKEKECEVGSSPLTNDFSKITYQPTPYSNIYQKDVIDSMVRSLQSLYTEQTLYLLLIFYKSHPNMVIPLSILQYLECKLSTANHLHEVLPFTFVKHPKKCLQIFMDQLEIYPNLKRHDNHFYSCEQDHWLLLIVNKQQVDIYCYFINMERDSNSPAFEEMATTIFKKTTDILFKVEKKTNQIILLQHLHITRLCSKYLEAFSLNKQNEERNIENEGVDEDITESYPSSSTSSGSSNDDDSEEEDESGIDRSKLVPNQFQCSMVYQKKFPLHWRVPLDKALNHLKSEVLRPFMVRNRPDMYVIEKDNIIVYCKLYETTIAANNDNSDVNTPILRQQQYADQGEESGKQFSSATSSLNSHTNNELILDVYGIECPDWICNDFVQLLDNRLFSEITLNEIQTFFSRNPTSKPSLEDVQFLLPFEKRRQYHKRQLLTIPKLVNDPIKFLTYYKKSILNCNIIKPFRGVNVVTEVQKYQRYWFYHMMDVKRKNQRNGTSKGKNRLNSYHGESIDVNDDDDDNDKNNGDELDQEDGDEGQILEKDELCFYYNLTKRMPGKLNNKLELNGGQGMAGICMTATTSQNNIVNRFSNSSFQFDPQLIKQSLKNFYHPTNRIDHEDIKDDGHSHSNNNGVNYFLWIELWTIGPVDDIALMNYFYQTFRQSLCDYFIEQTVSIDLGDIMLSDTNLLQSIDTHVHTHRQISTIIRKKFIDIILYMLKISLVWKNPTVHEMSKNIHIGPWNMKEIVHHLDKLLIQIDPSFEPTVTWKKVTPHFDLTTNEHHQHFDNDSDIKRNMNENDNIDDDDEDDSSDWLLYRGKPIYCRNNVQQNIKMVVIGGLNEFVGQFYGGGLHHSSILNSIDDNALTTVTTNSSHSFSSLHHHNQHLLQEQAYFDSRRSSIDTSKSYRVDSRRTSAGSRETNVSTGTTSHIHHILPRSYSSNTTNSYLKPNESNKQQQPPPLINSTIITNEIEDAIVAPQLDRNKHCFFIMIMDVQQVKMYAYNWSLSSCKPLFNTMMNMIHRQHLRSDVLNNILHQKMGLFHHTIRMKDMTTNYISNRISEEAPTISQATSSTTAMAPTTTTTTINNNNFTDQSIASLQTISTRKKSMITFDQKATNRKKENSLNSFNDQQREDNANSKDDTNKRKSSKKKMGSGSTSSTITDMNIQDVIMLPVDENEDYDTISVSENTTMSSMTTHLSSRLSMMHQQELNFVLMDLMTTSIFDNYRFSSSSSATTSSSHYYYYNLLREDDLLRRHGYTFIKTYIQQSNLKSFHKKALHIYAKWCRRYGELSLLSNTIQQAHHDQQHQKQKQDSNNSNKCDDDSNKRNYGVVDEDEKLTRYEVGEILRKARLMHFCRSPFFFGNNHHEQNHLPLSYCSMPILTNQLLTPTSTHSIELKDSNDEMMKLWYKDLLSSFVTRYTTYLEKLNMQPIEFASRDYESDHHNHIHYSIDEDTWTRTNYSMATNSTSASVYSNSDSTYKKQQQQENGKYEENDDDDDNDNDDNINEKSDDQNEENSLCYSTIEIGHNISLDYPVVFLLKVFDGGSIICEIRFTRYCFVSVTLYALHRHYGRMGYNRYHREDNETKRFNLKRFEENVSHFRHSIHINSFVYDFHLYYIQHILLKMNNLTMAVIKTGTNDDGINQGFTDGISLLKVLHQFSSFYKTPVRYSTNRLFHGVYEFKYDESLTKQEFFQYLYLQCQHFGFSTIIENKANVGICFTTSNISFSQNDVTNKNTSPSTTTPVLADPHWKHTLILCPISSTTSHKEEEEEERGGKEKNKIYIRYFIISVYQPEKSPFHMVKNIWKSNIAPNIDELITNARKRMDQMIIYILQYHQRKIEWQAIYQYSQQPQVNNNNNNKDIKILQLLKKFPNMALSILDKNIRRLLDLNTVDWHEFIELFLQIQKRSNSKAILLREDTNYQHILFYPPSLSSLNDDGNDKESYMDFLIHLKISSFKKYHDEPMINAYLIRREHPLDKYQSTQEKSYLESFGQIICYLLWKKCHS